MNPRKRAHIPGTYPSGLLFSCCCPVSAFTALFDINLEHIYTYIYAASSNMAISPEVAEIIRRKKTQYCRFADLNQFHLFDKIALPSATFKFAGRDSEVINENGIVYSWEDRETFCAAFTKAFENVQVVSVFGLGYLSPYERAREFLALTSRSMILKPLQPLQGIFTILTTKQTSNSS